MKLFNTLKTVDTAAERQGLSLATLMERAGHCVARAVLRHLETMNDHHDTLRIVVLCGPGNNGGDGFVAAHALHAAGVRNIMVVYTMEALSSELKAVFKVLKDDGIPTLLAQSETGPFLETITDADIIVDTLLGTGLSRPATGAIAALIQASNATRKATGAWVLAVDIPSGINSATGRIESTDSEVGTAIEADVTLTLTAPKPGLYLYPGKANSGQIQLGDIDMPAALLAAEPASINLMTAAQALDWLPARAPNSHKYTFGHVLVVAGSQSMPGASVLCSQSAASCGAGLVTLAAPHSIFQLCSLFPEIMRLPLSHADRLDDAGVDSILAALEAGNYHSILIGPGLGKHPETIDAFHRLLDALIARDEWAVTLDADALTHLASRPKRLTARFILTPHVGECARLLDCDTQTIMADLQGSAEAARNKYQCTVILKSATTITASFPNDTETQPACWLNPIGNAGMATAGSGDVLGGIVAALTAQRQAQTQFLWEAAPLAVYLHAVAGDAAARAKTVHAMRASHITDAFPDAFQVLLHSPETLNIPVFHWADDV